MNKKLAIKGHPTRGKEIIELLEMMGGKNCYNLNGLFSENAYYFIGGPYNDEIKAGEYIFGDEDMYMYLLTLEEFLEEYPFKVGDKVSALFQSDKTATNGFCSIATVTIKSMSWSEDCETMVYDFKETEVVLCAEDIESVNDTDDNNHTEPSKMKNVLAELLEHIKTTPKEDLEREFEEIAEWSNVGPTVEEFRTFCKCVNKKPIYPKTYAECCEVLNCCGDYFLTTYDNNGNPSIISNILISINILTKLLICRDAYWKIAGEQIGLGKPWEFENPSRHYVFTIENFGGKIQKNTVTARILNHILAFPTEEMRDAFYENFKDLIESCKELL